VETVAPIWSSPTEAWKRVFNSPIESGLRIAIILSEIYPEERDLQQLIQLDYLLVHSGDMGDGPPSIHPAHPYRASELHLRRPLVEQGLAMMLSKSIIECSMTPSGVVYRAGTWSLPFLNELQSAYTQQLKLSAKWIATKYAIMPPQELARKLKDQFQQWGAEFSPTTLALTESDH
jgi:hypothetical protein